MALINTDGLKFGFISCVVNMGKRSVGSRKIHGKQMMEIEESIVRKVYIFNKIVNIKFDK